MTQNSRLGLATAPPDILNIPQRVRAGIAHGQKYICTQDVCLGVWSTSWCPRCQAPRCDEHGGPTGFCSTCNGRVVGFVAITSAQPPDDEPYVGREPLGREGLR